MQSQQTDSKESPVRDYARLHQNKQAYHTKSQDDKHHQGGPAPNHIAVPSYNHYYPEEGHGKQYHTMRHVSESS